MKKIMLLCAFAIMSIGTTCGKTIYSCFLSQDMDMEKFEVSNQISENNLIDIILDGSTLKLGNQKVYSLFNRKVTNDGFIQVIHYDAVDGQNQRCEIKFITDSSADWATRNSILIWYKELSSKAKWYQSRDPQER